jgi:hypothetical protein
MEDEINKKQGPLVITAEQQLLNERQREGGGEREERK